jgi:PhnB protein
MAKLSLFEQLEQAIRSLPAVGTGSLPAAEPRIAQLAALAYELRELPRASFRTRLKSELQEAIKEQSERSQPVTTTVVNPIREGFHTLTPYLLAAGADRLIVFMQQAFGAEEVVRVRRPDGSVLHSQFRIGDSMIEAADPRSPFPVMPAAIHLYVPDADAVYRRALEAGAVSLNPMTDQRYGDREGCVKDPTGNEWYIATHQATGLAPKGFRAITPYLHPKGAAEVLAFVERAFGGAVVMRAQSPEGFIHHAQVRIGDSILEMGEAHGRYQPMPCALHLYVEDTDVLYERTIAAGAKSIYPPADQPYGDRGASLVDPFGNHWYLATRIR